MPKPIRVRERDLDAEQLDLFRRSPRRCPKWTEIPEASRREATEALARLLRERVQGMTRDVLEAGDE